MKTAPSFPFYPGDFIMGTMLMSAEEVGAYIRLLCFQWEQGHLPDCPTKTARIAGISEKKLSPVLEKFHRDDQGKLVNKRLEEVRESREHFLEIQRRNGQRGGRPKKPEKEPMGLPSVSNGLTQDEPKKTLPSPFPVLHSPSPLSSSIILSEISPVETKPDSNKKSRCTLEEARAFAVSLGLPALDGESCFWKWEGNGWKNGSSQVKDWKATIRNWKAQRFLPSQKPGYVHEEEYTPTSAPTEFPDMGLIFERNLKARREREKAENQPPLAIEEDENGTQSF